MISDKRLIHSASVTVAVGFILLQGAASAAVLPPSDGGNSFLHALGWQTFDNAGANNNSGISDTDVVAVAIVAGAGVAWQQTFSLRADFTNNIFKYMEQKMHSYFSENRHICFYFQIEKH